MSPFGEENDKLAAVAVEAPLWFRIAVKDQLPLLTVWAGSEIIVDHRVLACGVKAVTTRHARGNVLERRVVVAIRTNRVGLLLAKADQHQFKLIQGALDLLVEFDVCSLREGVDFVTLRTE